MTPRARVCEEGFSVAFPRVGALATVGAASASAAATSPIARPAVAKVRWAPAGKKRKQHTQSKNRKTTEHVLGEARGREGGASNAPFPSMAGCAIDALRPIPVHKRARAWRRVGYGPRPFTF